MYNGGEETCRRRQAANTASRTFRFVNFTITGEASVELIDFFSRCAVEISWVAMGMSSLFRQKYKTAFSVATFDSVFGVRSFPSADAASAYHIDGKPTIMRLSALVYASRASIFLLALIRSDSSSVAFVASLTLPDFNFEINAINYCTKRAQCL